MAPNQPFFDVTANFGNAVPNTDINPILFNAVNVNNGNNYSTTTGKFTAPVAGRYFFAAQAHNNASGPGFLTLQLWHNANIFSNACDDNANTGSSTINLHGGRYLAAGDTVFVRAVTSKSSNYINETYWKFTGWLVS